MSNQQGRGTLVLSRDIDQGILIHTSDGEIVVWLKQKTCLKLVINAPKSVKIDRLEKTNFKLPERKV